AAFAGVPAVAYAIGGITEWLVPGVTGEAAPGERPSIEDLAAAIVRALRDPDRLATLGRAAWERSGRFTIDAHVAALEEALTEAVQRRSGPETLG
ncbi:MAG TPA: glycosyltransferase, partial [Planctomycetota bacterium]|nr:glycosyltransferase [Planctomycetota bacterium]